MQAYAAPETGTSPQLRLVGAPPAVPAFPAVGDGGNVLDGLLDQLAGLVAERVAARLAQPTAPQSDEWMDTRRAAEYIGIGRGSVRRLAAEGTLHTEQASAGCKLYFRRSDLDAWRCSASAPIEPLRSRRHG